MNIHIRKPYNAQLPSTKCTKEMRDQIVAVAKLEKASLNEIQRAALSLFLSQYATDCSIVATETSEKAS